MIFMTKNFQEEILCRGGTSMNNAVRIHRHMTVNKKGVSLYQLTP